METCKQSGAFSQSLSTRTNFGDQQYSLRSSWFSPCHVALASVPEHLFDQDGEPCTKSLSQGQSAWISWLILNQAALEASTFESLYLRWALHKKTESSKEKHHTSLESVGKSGAVIRRWGPYRSCHFRPLSVTASFEAA